MNLIELATGGNSSEYKVVLAVLAVLCCHVLGIDVAVLLPLVVDGGDVVKYEELIKALGGRGEQSDAAIWALAMVGVGYPSARAYVKRLKVDLAKKIDV